MQPKFILASAAFLIVGIALYLAGGGVSCLTGGSSDLSSGNCPVFTQEAFPGLVTSGVFILLLGFVWDRIVGGTSTPGSQEAGLTPTVRPTTRPRTISFPPTLENLDASTFESEVNPPVSEEVSTWPSPLGGAANTPPPPPKT